MERVLIVAKTRMKSGICVSGLVRSSNKGVRLVPQNRQNQPSDSVFEMGQVWDIEYQEVTDVEPPHTEDVIVLHQHYVGNVSNLRGTLIQRVKPWQGGPESLFDGMLTLDEHKAYILRSGLLPNYSTGYWIPDRPLVMKCVNNKVRYSVNYSNNTSTLSIPFVGLVSPINQISPGTLVRVSLARWLPPYNDRCYLQVSGWYL